MGSRVRFDFAAPVMHDRRMHCGERAEAKGALVLLFALASAISAASACSSTPPAPSYLSRGELLDPEACKGCHADHFNDWSGSMHAYAAEDPVFLAMNARGQRETGGKLGTFCVQCHAPMAVREGATTDGLNLGQLPPSLKGITCFFCHTVDRVDGTSDNPLHLAHDTVMRGPFANPVANAAHPAVYSALHDRDQLESVTLCGTCHDIVNGHGIAIETTYQEWQGTVFSKPPVGDSCGQCHMNQSDTSKPVAQVPGAPPRRYHGHDFPAVDIALTPFPESETQKASVQAFLGTTLSSELCVGVQGNQVGIHVSLENAGAGHSWPSGSAQDRRAWVEVIAYAGANVIYRSGVVPDGVAVTTIGDPDLWLLRECMLDAQNNDVSMFWQAASPSENYGIPGQVTANLLDPAVYQNHVYQTFPRSTFLTIAPGQSPDRVTMRVRLQPIGLDVVDDLVASGDLDPSTRTAIQTFDIGPSPLVEWTPAKAHMVYQYGGVPFSCVSNTAYNPLSCLPGQPPTCSLAASHVHCKP